MPITMLRSIKIAVLLLAVLLLTQCGQKLKGSPPAQRIGEPGTDPIPLEEAEDAGFTPPATTKILWGAPIAGQSTNYSCGPAAMQSVFAYYGQVHAEEKLIKEMAATAKEGTDHNKMAEISNRVGIKAQVKHNVPIADVAAALAKDQLVVIECQAHDDRLNKDYATIWDAGHYMVVIGIDEQNIYFMDPSLGGMRAYLPLPEFMIRWHDLGNKGEKLQQTAIFFDAKINPVPLPQPWSKVP